VPWDEVRAELKRLTGTDLSFRPFLKDLATVVTTMPDMRQRVFELVDEHELAALETARLSDGAPESLSELSKDSRMALVTMQGRQVCTKILERLGIAKYFVAVFTREDSLDRATQLRKALEALDATPPQATFVGDRVNDLNAARAVGVRFVMIRSQPDSPPADSLFRSMRQFYEEWVNL